MTQSRSSKRVWADVLGSWKSCAVPDVVVNKFRLGIDHPAFPWVKRSTGHAISCSNPERTTAYHLAVHLDGKPEQTLVAYKLYAFAKDRDVKIESFEVLDAGMSVGGETLAGWWSGNARHVLPFTEQTASLERSNAVRFEWKKFVQAAAETWSAIAANYAVIRIPDFMPFDSPERSQYDAFEEQRKQTLERAEYERLKRKYD